MRKLKLLLAACALLGGELSANAYQTPVADGIYYLYNTACTDGTPGFMSTGNGYGFQVVIDKFGFPVKLIDAGNGNFQFQFIHHNGYLSDDGWMYSDGGTDRARTITIQDQGDGNYKLLNTNNSKEIEDWYGNVVGDGEGNRHNYIWQFLSKDERNAMIADYTKAQKLEAATSMGITLNEQTSEAFDTYISTNYIGIDQSSKIQNGTFDTSHNTEGWTTSNNSDRTFTIGWGNQDPKTTPEVYEGAGAITQKITVDKAGLYKVSVNATYRCGNSENNNRIGDLGYDGSVAYLQANNNFSKISDWYSGKINGNGPGSPSDANTNYFSAGKYYTEVYVYVGEEKTIDISLHSHAFTWGGWFMFNNFKLTYYSDEVSDEDATTILGQATALEDKDMDATIKTNLTSAKNAFEAAKTIANYNALSEVINEAQTSADAYALFAPEKAKALALGMTEADINALAPNVNALKVAEYNYVTTNFANAVSLGTWTKENATDRSGEHWDGTSTSTYSEQNEGWNGNNWSCSYSQNLSLPAGKYVFKVAGRKSSDAAVLELTVKNGTTVLGSVNDFPNGSIGKGIDTSGAANFGDGTFANNNNGRGWQWRYVAFELDEPATVNIAVSGSVENAKNQWVGFCNATVQTDNPDNVALMKALVALNSAKTKATLTKNENNIGDDVFQFNAENNNTLWSNYVTAKNNAENFSLTSSSTSTDVNALAEALETAIANYQNQALNAPDADKRYNLTIVEDGKDWDGNAVTFIAAGRTDQGNYGVKYLAPVNANLNQALKFTAVEGEANTYKISAIRVENGGEQYLTTVAAYEEGNDNIRIRTTDNADQAMKIKVEATATAGQFQLRNVAAKKIIANNNNNDMYTANSANFTIKEASEASVTVKIAEDVKYATAIFPFTPEELSGVTFYSCAAAEGNKLTLVKVENPEANKPYILESTAAVNQTLEGWGTAASETNNTAGWLTGVFAETTAPVGSYVLQNLDNVVGFYKVAEDKQPKVGANHAYMTIPATEPEARALFFDNATAIRAIEALTSGEAEIYNAAGARQNSLQKGVNIIKQGNKTYKVMVK